MPTETKQFEHALFSICASADAVETTTTACAEFSGTSFVGEFADYFSGDRKPQFSDEVNSAFGCVALVDCDRDPELALATMERLRTLGLRNLSIVAIATRVDATYLMSAMRSGCKEFLHKPLEERALVDALRRLQSFTSVRAAAPQSSGRILTFLGAKGGVGATTLAVHLAHSLAKAHNKRTLLIDHHHELGHVALYLSLKDGQYHFDELLHNADRLDAELLNGFVMRHPSGLHALGSPDRCSPIFRSGTEQMLLVLNFLKTQYDYVIIDSSMVYRDRLPTILGASDETFLVATPDIAALRDLARQVEHLSNTMNTSGKLRVVMNRTTSDDPIKAGQIETAVRHPVWMEVPAIKADLDRAVNSGEPISTQHRSGFAQQINRWADRVLVDPGEAKKKEVTRPNFFRFLRPKQSATA